MGLKDYKAKRNFSRTAEPSGKVGKRRRESLSFVIHKHNARRLHYDLRLELEGVLKSWAVPKGPSLDPAAKRLAVEVEDHPLEYGSFEGVIPEGDYGAGEVLVWDRGTWEPVHEPVSGLREGSIHFELRGKKLKGGWALVRMKGQKGPQKNWLLIKEKDEFADVSGEEIVEKKPNSVKSRKSIESIASAGRRK